MMQNTLVPTKINKNSDEKQVVNFIIFLSI